MILTIIVGTALAILLGFVWREMAEQSDAHRGFTKNSFFAACLVVIFVVSPAVSYAGYNIAKQNLVQYQQNLNGWETSTTLQVTRCTRDGFCTHTYDCDPYTVTTTHTNSDGSTYTTETTEYHDCPYCSEEWRLAVQSTVGEILMAAHNLPTNPQEHRYRKYDWFDFSIPSGLPLEWQQAKDRIESDKSGPVTVRSTYENFLLASQTTVLKQSTDSIQDYLKAELLPNFKFRLRDFDQLDRVYFVGSHPSGDWESAINRFNAAFGMKTQGDLNLVIADAAKIVDPDDYGQALLSYWQSRQFGRDAFSKNGFLIVLGTADGRSVAWARAYSGMPKGNEAVIDRVRYALVNLPLTPETLLGYPTTTKTSGYATTLTDSALEKLLLGEDGFHRVCMNCKGKGTEVGFAYLVTELQPTAMQMALIALMIVVCSVPVWWTFLYI